MYTTPLALWHKENAAVMVNIAGWEMPLHYAGGAVAEHLHTRTNASLFDFSHMGKFIVDGAKAASLLGRVITCNLENLKVGRCKYGFILNPAGGVQDDLVVYRLDAERFMLVVNAQNAEQDKNILQAEIGTKANLEDITTTMAKIDLQGPSCFSVLEATLPNTWKRLPYYGLTLYDFAGSPLVVSRTGYTGELGVEIYISSDKACKLWDILLEDKRVLPAGLGARDTLRLEVGLPLYGQDLNQQHTPAEAGFTAVLTSEADYIGRENAYNMQHRLMPMMLEGQVAVPSGTEVFTPQGKYAGKITSCLFSPSLERVIAFAYLELSCLATERNEPQSFTVGASAIPALTCTLPFYKKGTARIALM